MNNEQRDQLIHRHTQQREIIHEELCKLISHPTADELFQIVRERLPHISLATVYRNLELLAQQGAITKLELCGQQRRFDGNAAQHAHIRCLGCGAVADVDVTPRETPLDEVRAGTDYCVTGQRTEFVGQCPRCQADSVSPN